MAFVEMVARDPYALRVEALAIHKTALRTARVIRIYDVQAAPRKWHAVALARAAQARRVYVDALHAELPLCLRKGTCELLPDGSHMATGGV